MNIEKLKPWNWFKEEDAEREGGVRGGLPATPPGQDRLYGPFMRLQNEIDRLFEDTFRAPGFPGLSHRALTEGGDMMLRPSVDIAENRKDYTVTAEIPGVDEDDVKLELMGDTLIISGEKKQEKETEEDNMHRIERSYGSFRRTLSLPEDVDLDNIDARFDKGVLTVTLPRKEVAEKMPEKRKIEVHKAA